MPKGQGYQDFKCTLQKGQKFNGHKRAKSSKVTKGPKVQRSQKDQTYKGLWSVEGQRYKEGPWWATSSKLSCFLAQIPRIAMYYR